MSIYKGTLILVSLFVLTACSIFDRTESSDKQSKSAKLSDVQIALGPKLTDQGMSILLKFNCQPFFKLRAFKYKIHVMENNKEYTINGTQTAWLDANLTELTVKFAKTRKINFKNVVILTDKWLRAFPEDQLKEPIPFTLQECKDMGSY